jgi:hypothetical protein
MARRSLEPIHLGHNAPFLAFSRGRSPVIFLENTVETLMVEARAPFVLFGRSEFDDSWERTFR